MQQRLPTVMVSRNKMAAVTCHTERNARYKTGVSVSYLLVHERVNWLYDRNSRFVSHKHVGTIMRNIGGSRADY